MPTAAPRIRNAFMPANAGIQYADDDNRDLRRLRLKLAHVAE